MPFRRRKQKPAPEPMWSERFGADVLRALGIDPNTVTGFTMEFRVGARPNLTVIHEAWQPDVEAFLRTFEHYHVVARKSGETPGTVLSTPNLSLGPQTTAFGSSRAILFRAAFESDEQQG